jgi:hypothetical protein
MRSQQELKGILDQMVGMSPKERAAAWRRLTTEECAAAWTILTPQQRKADGEALATAWIEDDNGPGTKRSRQAQSAAARSLAAKGLIVDVGRRDGQVATIATKHMPSEGIERLLEGPVKHRALGVNAFHRGRSITDNPHPADTSEHQNWDFGFRAARAVIDVGSSAI